MNNIEAKPEGRQRLLYKKLQYLCANLNRSQRFYFFGTFVLILAAFWWTTPFSQIFTTAVILAGSLLVAGVVSDLLFIYSKVWATTIGKSVLLLLYALLSTVAYALAAQVVNEIVAYDSSKLNYTVTFVAILLVPIFIFGAIYVIFALIFALGQVYIVLVTHAEILKKDECLQSIIPANLEKWPGRTFLARVIIYPVAFGFLFALGRLLTPIYGAFVEESATTFIYHLEAVKHSRCEIPVDAKAIQLDDEIILMKKVGEKYKFEPRPCEPRVKPNN